MGGGEPGGQSLQRVRVADGLRRDESGLLGVRSFGERGGLHDDAGADGAGSGGPSAQDVVDRAGHRGVPRVQVRDRHRAVGVDAERQLLRVLQGDGRRVSGHRGVPARERGSDIAGEVWLRFPRLFVQRVSRRRAGRREDGQVRVQGPDEPVVRGVEHGVCDGRGGHFGQTRVREPDHGVLLGGGRDAA